MVLATLGTAIVSSTEDVLEMKWTTFLLLYAGGHVSSRWVSLGHVAIGLSTVAGPLTLWLVRMAANPASYHLSFTVLTVFGSLALLGIFVMFSFAVMVGAVIGRTLGP